MAPQESSLRDNQVEAQTGRETAGEKLSLVVDRPAAGEVSLLILPFAASAGEEALGRQAGLLVQRRLSQVAGLVVGHGLLVATGVDGRRYVPPYYALSDDQAYACGAIWQATAVLSGSITLKPALRWALTLRHVGIKKTLFEDELVGDAEDLLDAAGDVALTMARTLSIPVDERQIECIEQRETGRLDALLAYLCAADLLPRHGITQADPLGARIQLFQALVCDPAFTAPIAMLTAELVEHAGQSAVLDLVAAMERFGPSAITAMTSLALALDNEGHSAHAVAVAGAILGQQPDSTVALGLVGQHAYRMGHFNRARLLVARLLELDPDSPVPYVLQGNVLAATNRVPGAAIQWEIALGFDPNQPKILLRLGSYLATVGEYQRAFEVLSRAVALGASTPDSLYQLGSAAYRLGHLVEAIEALATAITMNPDLPYLHIMLARCYGRTGRDDLAEHHDARALELSPGYWPSALAVGYSALNQGRTDEALKAYTLVATVRPDLPEALYGLGIALVANNMVRDGLEALFRARELAPQDVSILCAVAVACLRLEMLDEAQATVYDAMRLKPDNPDVIHCVEEVHRYLYG